MTAEEFGVLYATHYAKAVRIARGVTRNTADAEDAVSMAAEYILSAPDQLAEITPERFITVARSRALNVLGAKQLRASREEPTGTTDDLAHLESVAVNRALGYTNHEKSPD